MSHTITATRGMTPDSVNLSVFSHPAIAKSERDPTSFDSIMQQILSSRSGSPVASPSPAEDLFNLDMVTMDMDFEQAYSMYAQPHKHTLDLDPGSRTLGMNTTNGNFPSRDNSLHNNAQLQTACHGSDSVSPFSHPHAGHDFSQQLANKQWSNVPQQTRPKQQHLHHQHTNIHHTHNNHLHNNHLHNNHLHNNHLHNPRPTQSQLSWSNLRKLQRHSMPQDTVGSNSLISPPVETIDSFSNIMRAPGPVTHTQGEGNFNENGPDVDQFFSANESSALDKFLDNLAFSSEVNPLEFYHQNQPKVPRTVNLQTMNPADSFAAADNAHAETIKREISEAFKHSPAPCAMEGFSEPQLAEGSNKRPLISHEQLESVDENSGTKKKRRSSKPLLSSEQKRLNHSHSEQRRRQLCKEAYERCLRLVANVDDYKNDLVSACSLTSSKKKSKRKQINKEGLPNLSKHTALLKISSEIMKIQSKNEGLKRLIGEM